VYLRGAGVGLYGSFVWICASGGLERRWSQVGRNMLGGEVPFGSSGGWVKTVGGR
jgi:hypothetical protein